MYKTSKSTINTGFLSCFMVKYKHEKQRRIKGKTKRNER